MFLAASAGSPMCRARPNKRAPLSSPPRAFSRPSVCHRVLRDAPVEKAAYRRECAKLREIFVPCVLSSPKLLRFRRHGEERTAKPYRHDPIAPAMQDQDWRAHLADPGELVETIAH